MSYLDTGNPDSISIDTRLVGKQVAHPTLNGLDTGFRRYGCGGFASLNPLYRTGLVGKIREKGVLPTLLC